MAGDDSENCFSATAARGLARLKRMIRFVGLIGA
jgi:hypothetical protein